MSKGIVLSAVAKKPHHTAATPTMSEEVHHKMPSLLVLAGLDLQIHPHTMILSAPGDDGRVCG